MELYQIRHFVAVVETGSFTKGAQRVAVTQPALSASIARLEAELEVRLLDRKRSRVVPTAAGARLLETARSVLLACNAVKADLKSAVAPKSLRIGVLRTLSVQRVSMLLGAFLRTQPNVAVEVFDGPREDLSKRLTEQKVDAILTNVAGDKSRFATRPLFKEPYVLATPRDHRFAQEKSVKLADLEGEPFIVRTGCETFQQTNKLLLSLGIKTRPVYKTDQDDRALSLVAAGVGVALFPRLIQSADVRQVKVSDFDVVRTIGLQWYRDREDEHLQFFIKFAQSHDWGSAAAQ